MLISLQKTNKIMENEKLGQEPAFPKVVEYMKDRAHHVDITNGMSKRFYAACAAMQGLLSNSLAIDSEFESICKASFMAADELLKQENE